MESFGGNEGDYGKTFRCPYNYFLNGAQLRSEAPQGSADDSACMFESKSCGLCSPPRFKMSFFMAYIYKTV